MSWAGSRVLITGGAGFIGSTLADRLLVEGCSVRILDNFTTGDRSNISSSAIEVIEGDVRDAATVDKAMEGVEFVFHEAAHLNPAAAVEKPLYDFDVNVRGGLNVLMAAATHRPRKVVVASTNVYARATVPIASENVPVLFMRHTLLSPYAAAKVAVEAYAKVFSDECGVPVIRLRYSNVIGPRQRTKTGSGVVALFTEWLFDGRPLTVYGDGDQRRDFVSVDDVVEANILAATAMGAEGEVFNVGVGEETSVLQIAQTLMSLTGKTSEIRFLPPRAADYAGAKIDLTRAREVLGYIPKKTTRQALEEYVKWHKQTRG